jgi:hypothetical protein
MSQSPYAPTPYETGYDPASEPTRTSVMAILSIVFSLICILPGTGVIGILLGVGALVAIGKSNGRLEGKGAALSGIILGLITTVLWAAVGFGLLQGYTFYTKRMVPTGERFFMALSAGDLDAARAELTVDANEDVTDERLMLFAQEIETRIGSVQGAADSWNSMGQSFGRVFGGGGSGQPPQTNVSVQNQDAVAPIGILGDADSMIAWLVFDEQTLTGGPKVSPKIRDAFVQFENQDIVTLRADGPGQAAAGQIGQGQLVEPGADEPDEDDPAPQPDEAPEGEPLEEPTEPTPM